MIMIRLFLFYISVQFEKNKVENFDEINNLFDEFTTKIA